MRCKQYERLCLTALAAGAVFAVAMVLLRGNMVLNIALTVGFIFLLFALIYRYGKRQISGQ